MKTTGAVITEIVEAYNCRYGQWVSVTEIANRSGLTRDELAAGLTELLEDPTFRAEPQAFSHRIADADRAVAPIIGGEARHLIRWY